MQDYVCICILLVIFMRIFMLKKILPLFMISSVLACFTSAFAQQEKNIDVMAELAKLEKEASGRLGITLIDTKDNSTILYRANERFPMASTSKVMVVTAILKRNELELNFLNKKIPLHKKDIVIYSPIAEKNLAKGMTIEELCKATLQYSDNAAMNKLLEQMDGPKGATKFARSINDQYYQLDRIEPLLNTAIPNDNRDTTTPLAMANSLQNTIFGNVLASKERALLTDWMKGNTTGGQSIKAGLPKNWIVGDKTGMGEYGTTNDVAIIWPESREPLILTVYFTQNEKDASPRKDVLAEATRIVTQHVTQ